MAKEYESHKPTDFSFFALVAIFVVNALIVFNMPLHNDPPWWGRLILSFITFFGGGFIYCAAMESVAVVLKIVMEAAWAIFLLPVTVGFILAYEHWAALVQLAVDLGADEKTGPGVAFVGCAVAFSLYSMAVWAVLYPLSIVAGTDPRKEYRVGMFLD